MRHSYYGEFRTRTYADIFPDLEKFTAFITGYPIDLSEISEDKIKTVYYLLYARFGNTPIVNSDENQFKARIISTMFMYGPSWSRRLEIQKALRQTDIENLRVGTKSIYNHSFNPSTTPRTLDKDELDTINDQNTAQHKKSLIQAYAELTALLREDVTLSFINKFAPLFIKIAAPDYPLLYAVESEDDEDE